MRIIGGQWRGRRLFAPEGMETRPTSDKVREARSRMGVKVRVRRLSDEVICHGARKSSLPSGVWGMWKVTSWSGTTVCCRGIWKL